MLKILVYALEILHKEGVLAVGLEINWSKLKLQLSMTL